MKKFAFILFPALSIGVGALSGYFTRTGLETVYPLLEKSELTPPGGVFPIVWTVLYLLMGLGMALVVRKGGPGTGRSVFLWITQLGLNCTWSLLFFNSGNYLGALVCLAVLWFVILAMTISFAAKSRLAAWLQVPYLAK